MAAAASACGDDNGGGSTGLPDGIPTLAGSELDPNTRFGEGDAFTGTWRTGQDAASVRDYFTGTLEDGGWNIIETHEIDGGFVIIVEDADDPAHDGTIIIRREGDSTRIVKTIGRDDPDDEEAGDNSGDPGDEVTGALPDGYPDDVPLPEDAEIVAGSAPLIGSDQYFLVEFTTPGAPESVIAFFNTELPARGWTTGAADNAPSGFILNFTRDGDEVTITGGGSGDGTDAALTIVVRE
jgi:hypothetical protein